MQKWDNYDKMTEQAGEKFLSYDQDSIIKRWGLQADINFIYLTFAGGYYRIDRRDGRVEGLTSHKLEESRTKAGFAETMSIYDVLCGQDQRAELAGRWSGIYSLGHVVYRSKHNIVEYSEYETLFDHKLPQLRTVCREMGGMPESYADLCYVLPVFDFLPVKFVFWESDEEFPSKLQFLWDENTLRFMRFETTFYVVGHILQKMKEKL